MLESYEMSADDLVEEMKNQGHQPIFFVPENYPFKLDYHTQIEYLEGGEAVSYAGVSKLKKLYLSLVREKRRVAWFLFLFRHPSG